MLIEVFGEVFDPEYVSHLELNTGIAIITGTRIVMKNGKYFCIEGKTPVEIGLEINKTLRNGTWDFSKMLNSLGKTRHAEEQFFRVADHESKPKKQTLLEFCDEYQGYKGNDILPKEVNSKRELVKMISEYFECFDKEFSEFNKK